MEELTPLENILTVDDYAGLTKLRTGDVFFTPTHMSESDTKFSPPPFPPDKMNEQSQTHVIITTGCLNSLDDSHGGLLHPTHGPTLPRERPLPEFNCRTFTKEIADRIPEFLVEQGQELQGAIVMYVTSSHCSRCDVD